jgi:ABC-type transport system substrate-binding protein
MTWVFLTNDLRNKIALKAGPYVVDSYEPHEQAVRERNPRDNWKSLTKEERKATVDGMQKPFYMCDLFAAIEAKLKEKNT